MSSQVGLINTGNVIGNLVNGSLRTGFVIIPSLIAGLAVAQIGRKACIDVLTGIFRAATGAATGAKTTDAATTAATSAMSSAPTSTTVPSSATKTRTERVWAYLEEVRPQSTAQINYSKEFKNFAAYSTVAIASTFVLNKLIGNAPELYNNFAKYLGNAIRFDVNFDVIQMGVDRILALKYKA